MPPPIPHEDAQRPVGPLEKITSKKPANEKPSDWQFWKKEGDKLFYRRWQDGREFWMVRSTDG